MEKTCINCKYCAIDMTDLFCTNDKSEYLADFITTRHTCDEWCPDEEE